MRIPRLQPTILAVSAWLAGGVPVALAEEAGADHGEYSLAGDLSFWSLVVFVLFLWVIKKMGWGGFVSGLNDRERTQQELIDVAEREAAAARQILTERKGRMEAIDEEVREQIAEAGRDAAHTRGELEQVANREAELARQRARLEIARVRDQSLNEIFETFANRVADATEQRVRQSVGGDEQNRLIDTTLEQFSAASR